MSLQPFLAALSVTTLTIVQALAQSTTAPHKGANFAAEQQTATETGAAKTEADDATSEVREKVVKMKASIAEAAERLKQANDGTFEDRLKDLDALIADIKKAIAEVSSGGEVYEGLSKAIKITEEEGKSYKLKMTDATKSKKAQSQFQEMARFADQQKNMLYQSQMALNTARNLLEDQLKEVEENRELVVGWARLRQMEKVNEAVRSVVDSMNGVTTELGKLVDGIAAKPIP